MVAWAAELGLQALAITDHDTVAGLAEALAAGRRLGVQVVTGVELSTDAGGRELHLLGYGFDPTDAALCELLAAGRQDRRRRAAKIVARLADLGVRIELEQVLALGAESVGRPHVARVLVERGFVASVAEAFARYLAEGRPAYVPRRRLRPEQAIAAVHQAGGVAVIAHPALFGDDAWVRRLAAAGLDGLETDHSEHPPAAVAHYARLAAELGLLPTAGSDSHGEPGRRPLGSRRMSWAEAARLLARCIQPAS